MATETDRITSGPSSSSPGPIERYADQLVRRAALLCVAARDMPEFDADVLTEDLRTACATLLSSQTLLLPNPNHRSCEVPLSDVADWLSSVAARVRADDVPDPFLDSLAPHLAEEESLEILEGLYGAEAPELVEELYGAEPLPDGRRCLP